MPLATLPIHADSQIRDAALRAEARIESLLLALESRWSVQQPDLRELTTCLRGHVAAGGKRLRPAFCTWGAIGAGEDPDSEVLVDVCAALELLHAFALIHDDVMDGSATRRGRPAAHVEFESRHVASGWLGEPRRTGEGLAILVGDLAFVLADVLLDAVPRRVRAVWQEMRLELVAGQWVDVVATARGSRDREQARWVARYKSGRYTVERPLHLGAAIAGRLDLVNGYSRVGEPLGEAFQLRDDVLGVFGAPETTGKPAGDDLREGKPTALLAITAERAGASARRLLARVGCRDLGDDEVEALRALVVECGALGAVEAEIDRLARTSLAAIDDLRLNGEADTGLRALVDRVAWRDR
jgi:geranylgeranyl diphosphate synthase, type I